MRSYPNLIPLSAKQVTGIAVALEPFQFDTIYGHYFDRVITSGGKRILEISVKRYVDAISGVALKVWERVGELQAEQYKRLQPKLDISKERIGRRLHMASEMAEQDRNPHAVVASELGLAKVFGHLNGEPQHDAVDFKQARTMTDIGRKLLQSVGFASPDDASIQAAIEANDVFVERLEAIRDAAQGPAINEGD